MGRKLTAILSADVKGYARAEVAEVLRLSPKFSLEVYRQTLPIKDQAGVERFLDLRHRAGLK